MCGTRESGPVSEFSERSSSEGRAMSASRHQGCKDRMMVAMTETRGNDALH